MHSTPIIILVVITISLIFRYSFLLRKVKRYLVDKHIETFDRITTNANPLKVGPIAIPLNPIANFVISNRYKSLDDDYLERMCSKTKLALWLATGMLVPLHVAIYAY
jgi:hypothetical protein